jgi:hypothetical protein
LPALFAPTQTTMFSSSGKVIVVPDGKLRKFWISIRSKRTAPWSRLGPTGHRMARLPLPDAAPNGAPLRRAISPSASLRCSGRVSAKATWASRRIRSPARMGVGPDPNRRTAAASARRARRTRHVREDPQQAADDRPRPSTSRASLPGSVRGVRRAHRSRVERSRRPTRARHEIRRPVRLTPAVHSARGRRRGPARAMGAGRRA